MKNPIGKNTLAIQPKFSIGKVPVLGDVIFAPMAGFADVPTREISTKFGSALQYTEFIAVEEILNQGARNIRLIDIASRKRPVVVQLFGNDSQKFLEAAKRVEELKPDIIDINMGCSTRRVSGRGAGVGMMPDLMLIEDTFSLLSKNLRVPVTAKIRLGWDEKQNYLQVGRLLEDCGAAAIAIHPRTKEQKYNGSAKWEAVAELKSALKIPIIGNGDIRYPGEIDRMLEMTGCDAVMIGRGAIGNPWLLARIEKNGIAVGELTSAIRLHWGLMVDYYGPRGQVLFRKHVKRYLAGIRQLEPFSKQLVGAESNEQFSKVLIEINRLYGDQPIHEIVGLKLA